MPGYADTRRSARCAELDACFHGKTLQLPAQSAPTRRRGCHGDGRGAATPADDGAPAASQAPRLGPSQSLLDYLLGSDG